jgi:DNA-binding NarL/FixJ family response regulator
MPPSFTDEGLRAAVELRRTRPSLAVVVLSQYVQHAYAADLLDSSDGRGVGYLLKDRVADVEEFITALRRVCSGGTIVDPQVISQLVRRRRDPLAALSVREREVLTLIAAGQSNAAIARTLVVTEAAVGKHVGTSSPGSGCPRQTTPTAGSWQSSPAYEATPHSRETERNPSPTDNDETLA